MRTFILSLLGLYALSATAQTAFTTMDSIDANRINASALVHGDMWWNPVTQVAHCKFPPDSKKNFGFIGSLWLSGYDNGGQLHVAAQTYRQDGNDYWPGPLDGGGTLDYATSTKWAKIWKVRRSEINAHRANATHNVTNTPAAVLSWPGKGNANATGNAGAALAVTTDMAPFVDLNGNGTYEPLNGEYPDVPGEQALWWIFSDNGPSHAETDGVPLGAEVHVLAYAFSRNTLIDYVVYYEYTVVNRSANNYHDLRLALRNDGDLGHYNDDFMAFDSARRMGIIYNATNDDGLSAGHPENSYGLNPPAMGVTFISMPGDAAGSYVPLGSFTYYNNDWSIIGNPTVDTEYNNYMRSKIRSGAAFTAPPGWDECTAGNTPGDRREIMSTNDITLNAGAKFKVVMALVVDSSAGGCPVVNFNGIKTVADTAWNVYHTEVGIRSVAARYGDMRVYPNPAKDRLYIDIGSAASEALVSICNAMGQMVYTGKYTAAMRNGMPVGDLAPGMYVVSFTASSGSGHAVFVKQ